MDWLIENYEWLLSGAGIFILGFIIDFFRKKRSSKDLNDSTGNSPSNKIKAKKVSLNQIFVNNSNTGDIKTKSYKQNKSLKDPDLKKIKDTYFGAKNKFRTYLIKKLADERNKNLYLQIHHITDAAEDEKGIEQTVTFSEIIKLKEEGLISFELENNEIPSPYTYIVLTEKYFELL